MIKNETAPAVAKKVPDMNTRPVWVRNLSKSYGDFKVFESLNLEVQRGEIFGLLGPNGAGKTTALECILGTRDPDDGRAELWGEDPRRKRSIIFNRVGVQFQAYSYPERIRVWEICELIASLHRNSGDWDSLLGVIFGDSPAGDPAGVTRMQQAFAGVTAVGICASGLMGLPLTMASYREKKILKRFKVTPTSPAVMLAAQVLASMVFAGTSAFLVWITARIFFGYTMPGSLLRFLAAYALVLLSIYALGMVITSISKNVKTANLLCSLIYFPMFFLSGGTIPYEIMPRGLQRVSNILPLTQGIKLLKATSLGVAGESVMVPVLVLSITATAGIFISIKTFKWE